MKLLYIIVLILILFSSCSKLIDESSEYEATKIYHRGGIILYLFYYKGHEYLINSDGGIVEVKE